LSCFKKKVKKIPEEEIIDNICSEDTTKKLDNNSDASNPEPNLQQNNK